MASTFFGLSIGTSGLYTYQAALNITGHNASNAETVGYTRQLINQKASAPISVYSSYGMIGTGVEATGITQVRNNYYDTKYRTNTAISGMYSTKEHYMVEIENYFNEIENEGFMTNLTKLGESLQELTKDTTSNAVRTQITQYGSSLTEYISYMAKSLNSIQEEANTEIKNTCDRINSLAEQIAMLTKQINTMEVGGATACDLRDSRNNLVDELSQYANISVEENVIGNGVGKTSYVVKLNGKILVNTNEYNSLQVKPKATKDNINDLDGLYEVNWSDGQEFDLSSPTLGGTLQALFQVRDGNNGLNFNGSVTGQTGNVITLTGANVNDELLLNIPQSGKITIGNKEVTYDSFTFKKTDAGYEYQFSLSGEFATNNFVGQHANIGNIVSYKGIPYYQNQLNEFARTLAKSFNAIHQEGTNLNGTNGLDFFTGVDPVTGGDYSFYHKGDEINSSNSYYQLTALNFNVNQEIKKDPNNIATARELTDGVEKADILQELVACLSDKSMFKEGSPETFLESLIADIAIDTKKAEDFSTSQQNILKAIDNQRLSVSGVDVDEEAMNLIRYQNAYNLSAKVISVMDEIYDRLINYMGV